MALCNVKLSTREINDQKNYAALYLALIQKELSYGDLVNLENVRIYTEAFKHHSILAADGYVLVEMPESFNVELHNSKVI
jgi:hypothetical protein